MRKIIKKIPLFGNLIVKLYRKIKKAPHFENSEQFWKDRYKFGGNSGSGSYNNLAEFKGKIINAFLDNKDIKSVIEFGCGDGNQLKYLNPNKYLGYDVSEKAIQLCKEIFKNDNTKIFKLMNSYLDNERAELTMSLDVIYHLVEDHIYLKYMNRLFESSEKYVIIYSSNINENEYDGSWVRNRKFTDWVENHKNEFKLIDHIINEFPYDGDGTRTSHADFFIYEKK